MNRTHPLLMVSVRDVLEAKRACLGGADWIDLKEPGRGPLGALDAAVAAAVAESVSPDVPLTAAGGELVDWRGLAASPLAETPRVERLKLGLSRCAVVDWQAAWLAAREELAAVGCELTPVAYVDADRADSPPLGEVFDFSVGVGSEWLVLDTFDKTTGRLVDFLPATELAALAAAAHAAGMRVVAAGRLDAAGVIMARDTGVDMVAVRSAACGGCRSNAVDVAAVARLRSLLAGGELGPMSDSTPYFSQSREFS